MGENTLYSHVSLDDDIDNHIDKLSTENLAIRGSDSTEIVLSESSTKYEQLSHLVGISVPVSMSFLLTMFSPFINLIFCGMLVTVDGSETTILAGVSLSTMFYNVCALSVIVGLCSAVDTLTSYHNGAGNYREVGLTFYRSCLLVGGLTLPLIFVLLSAGDIFASIGIDKDVSVVAQRFLNIRLLTIPVDVISQGYLKSSVAVGIVAPTVVYSAVINIMVLGIDYMAVKWYGLGYEALAWSLVLSNYAGTIGAIWSGHAYPEVRRAVVVPSWAELTHPRKCQEFITLGFPAMLMLGSEWWAYEVLTAFAGIMGPEETSAQAILMQLLSLSFMVPLGLSTATCTIIGNALGRKELGLAASVGKVALSVNSFIQALVSAAIWMGGTAFVELFTKDTNVVNMVSSSLLFMAGFVFFDGTQAVGSGILRGTGKQKIGAIMNLVAFYIIGLPLSYTFCFRAGLGINGLMQGLFFGCLFQCSVLLWLILKCEKYVYTPVVDDGSSPEKGTESGSVHVETARALDIHDNDRCEDDDGTDDAAGEKDGVRDEAQRVEMAALRIGRGEGSGKFPRENEV